MPRDLQGAPRNWSAGGARSGKSAYAQQRAQEWDGRLVCLATAEGKDEEMKKRLASHRARRRSRRWETVEEPLEVVWQSRSWTTLSAPWCSTV